jgi:Fic family protein
MSDGFKFDPANMPRIDLSTTNHLANSIADSIAANQREMERSMQIVQRERERKEAAEAAYREEAIRSLRAIEQNTASLYTLVDLISKSNEQQDDLIEIIAEVLTIAKAKNQAEAKSVYTKVMVRITQTIKDAETLAKIAGYATAVWNLAQPIIEKLPHIGG